MNEKIVATWGAFDGRLHPGHLNFLETCARYGRVVVFLLDDAGIRRQKSRDPVYSQAVRKQHLLATGLVDQVIEGGPDQLANIDVTLELDPDVYCFGEDQTSEWNQTLRDRLEAANVTIIETDRFQPEIYSTTRLHFDDK